jgi:hypothetical protein
VVDAANQVVTEAQTLADHADAQLKAALAGTVLTGDIVGITIPAAHGSKAAADDRLAKAQAAANQAATAKAADDTVVARAAGLGKGSAGTGALGSPAPTGTPEKSCADAAATAAASAQATLDAANSVVGAAKSIADKADALLAAAIAEAVATAGVMSPAVPGATAAQKAAHDMLDKAQVTANLAVTAKPDADAAAAKTAGLLDLPQDKGLKTGTTAPTTTSNPATGADASGASHPSSSTTATAPTGTGSGTPSNTSSTPAPTSGAEAAAAGADQTAGLGAPELHDFPQIAGVVRKSYSDSQREAAEALSTDYTSSLSPEEVMTQLGRGLTDTGWSETSRNDSGDAAAFTQFIWRKWTRLSQTADIRITQTKANGCTLYVALAVDHIGILGATAATLTATDPGIEPAGGSPNDQGDHDPSNLPRIARSLRKSFVSSGSLSSELHETAVYRVKVGMAQAEGFYVNRLATLGDWEETERRETANLDDGSHQIILFMKLGRSTVEIHLDEEVPGAVTTITVMSTIAPAHDPRV